MRVETFDAMLKKKCSRVGSGDDGITAVVKVNQIVSEKRRDAEPTPRHAEDDFWNSVKSLNDVPCTTV
jgi:hypothetical protein